MAQDWIKLHRQFRETAFYGQAIPVALWIECLLRASWESRERFIGREKVHLGAGEFVMGYQELGDTVGCGKATAKAWLDIFEQEGMVERKRTAKGTICKLKKWSEYQDTRTQTDRARTDGGPPTDPNKNVKKVRTVVPESDVVIPAGESVAADAATPAQYAERFFAKSADVMREEAEHFVNECGFPVETVRQEFARFCLYWCERTPGGKKQRWQTEKTFEVRRRLTTWFQRAAEQSTKAAQRTSSAVMPDFRTPQ